MKPMKPVTVENDQLKDLRFPLIASLKLDGIRCVIVDGEPLSNTLKRIPNNHIYESLKKWGYTGFDGELLLCNEDNPNQPGLHNFNDVQSAVMNKAGTPNFILWVFDVFGCLPSMPFASRLNLVKGISAAQPANCKSFIKFLPQVLCNTLAEVMAFEEWALTAGYEGIMLRSLTGTYKFGRSTFKEHFLLRRKPFVTEECVVIGFVEAQTNTNEAYQNELGHTKRSSSQDGLVPAGTLGSFIVKNKKWGQFTLGCGKLTHAERQLIWDEKAAYLGNVATFKYQSIGTKDKPRILFLKHFRNQADMTAEQLALL